MRILLVHNRYQLAGGEDAVLLSEKALLEAHGHSVSVVAADNDAIQGFLAQVLAAARASYSIPSRRRLEAELCRFRPDVVHIHNLFPVLSPSVLYACAAARVPVVHTLHNYRLLCPSAMFFHDGAVCEECQGRVFAWPAVRYACYRNSRLGTFLVAAMTAMHSALGTYSRKVTTFIALTEFAREKFVQGGVPPAKIRVKPNFIAPDPGQGGAGGDYFLFAGRLSPEKGIDVLLRAWQELGRAVPLRIIGTGPLAAVCAKAAAANPAIQYLGPRPAPELYHAMGEARALILPSRWYEGFPRTIVESFAKGTPVIAPDLGSMREIIAHQHTGLRFTPGDHRALVEAIQWALSHPGDWDRMRAEARREYEIRFAAGRNYALLMDIYQDAIAAVKGLRDDVGEPETGECCQLLEQKKAMPV